MSLTGTERTIRNHYTPVCRCVWDGNDEWPTRVEATTDCVIHGDIPDPLLALLREVGELRQRLKAACEPCAECGHVSWRELDLP